MSTIAMALIAHFVHPCKCAVSHVKGEGDPFMAHWNKTDETSQTCLEAQKYSNIVEYILFCVNIVVLVVFITNKPYLYTTPSS